MDWSVESADRVITFLVLLAKAVLAALILYGSALLIAWNQDRSIKLRRHFSAASLALTFSIAVAGVYVTYSIFRNQAQQNSEFALNNHGTNFVNWERERPEIICLYVWHAFDDPAECRSLIFASPSSYRATMLYIEETLFLLETAVTDRSRWGSRYAQDIDYWAEDISDDPTGMFAYNLVSENADPQAAVERSGLSMTDEKLCIGFDVVASELAELENANLPDSVRTDPMAFCRAKLEAARAAATAH